MEDTDILFAVSGNPSALLALPAWYSSGKSPAQFVFEENVTTTITGSVAVVCPTCDPGSVIMSVFIHTLSPVFEAPPPMRIPVNVTVPTDGTSFTYAVNFTVTPDDSGGTTGEELELPKYVYKGVGFEFTGLGLGNTVQLWNPVITTEDSRFTCETRVPGKMKSPVGRVKFDVPHNQCVMTPAQRDKFPALDVGECACALPHAGPACDCVNTIGKFGTGNVCGGYGDGDGVILSPGDGTTIIRPRDGVERGCFHYDGEFAGTQQKSLQACKCLGAGRVYYTQLVLGAAFDYPHVLVDVAPSRDRAMFTLEDNPDEFWLTKVEVDDACESQRLRLPYFSTSDEVRRFTDRYIGRVIFTTAMETGVGAWQFEDTDIFLVNSPGDPGVNLTALSFGFGVPIDCDTYTEQCAAMNFNNLVYNGTLSDTSVWTNGITDDDFEVPVGDATFNWRLNSGVTNVVVRIWQAAYTVGTGSFSFPGGQGAVLSSNPFSEPREFTVVASAYEFSIDAGVVMAEVQVHAVDDTTRFPAYAGV